MQGLVFQVSSHHYHPSEKYDRNECSEGANSQRIRAGQGTENKLIEPCEKNEREFQRCGQYYNLKMMTNEARQSGTYTSR